MLQVLYLHLYEFFVLVNESSEEQVDHQDDEGKYDKRHPKEFFTVGIPQDSVVEDCFDNIADGLQMVCLDIEVMQSK